MIDCYMSWDAPVVREMARRLTEFNIYWFEDLLTPDRLSEQAVLREQIKPVLAAGESTSSHTTASPRSRGQGRWTCGSRT